VKRYGMAKKILFTVLSVVLAYNTYKLAIIFFELSQEQFSCVAIIVSAVAFNLLGTGAVALLGFVYPTSRMMPGSYYHIRKAKTLDFLYKWLGVEYFRSFLLKTFYRKEDNKKYFDGTRAGISLFDYNTRQSEFGHLVAFILVFTLSLILLCEGHWCVFVWMLPFNIFLNFYPILLQRKHRIIVERLMSRMDSKKGS